jgi:hypothetical protein
MSRSRILTWGYNTHVVAEFFGASDQQNITQHGHNLVVALQQEQKRDVSLVLFQAWIWEKKLIKTGNS